MTKLETLVSEAIAIDREISTLEEKLKLKKAELVLVAKDDKDNQSKTEKGGWSWSAKDSEGNIARVTIAGRSIKEGIDLEGKLTDEIRELLPKGIFAELFQNATYYKLVDEFRKRADELLEKPVATKLIKLVTSKGKTSVAFETKQAEIA